MSRRPSFQFYPGDWRNDEQLRMVSIAARGLWIEMICIMHQASPYGHLKVGAKVIDAITLGRLVGETEGDCQGWLSELESMDVYAVANGGCIYSRRLVRDEKTRQKRAAGGHLGGNPALGANYNLPGKIYAIKRASDGAIKIGISASPTKRIYRIRQQFKDDELTMMVVGDVEDMGLAEASAHRYFRSERVEGEAEWFSLSGPSEEDLIGSIKLKRFPLADHLESLLKVKPKVSTTPSSSSSSPSSSSSSSSASPRAEKNPSSTKGCAESDADVGAAPVDPKRKRSLEAAIYSHYLNHSVVDVGIDCGCKCVADVTASVVDCAAIRDALKERNAVEIIENMRARRFEVEKNGNSQPIDFSLAFFLVRPAPLADEPPPAELEARTDPGPPGRHAPPVTVAIGGPSGNKKLTPQQERVKLIWGVYEKLEIEKKPTAGAVAKWCKMYADAKLTPGDLARDLESMAGMDQLANGTSYAFKCLQTAIERGNAGKIGKAQRRRQARRRPPGAQDEAQQREQDAAFALED